MTNIPGCTNKDGESIYVYLENFFVKEIERLRFETIPGLNVYSCVENSNCKQNSEPITDGFGFPDCGRCDTLKDTAALITELNTQPFNNPEIIKVFAKIIVTGLSNIYDIYFKFLQETSIEANETHPNLRALERLVKSLNYFYQKSNRTFNLQPYVEQGRGGLRLKKSIKQIVKDELGLGRLPLIKEFAEKFYELYKVNDKSFAYESLFNFLRSNKTISNGKMFYGSYWPNYIVQGPSRLDWSFTTRTPFDHIFNFLSPELIPSLNSYLNIEFVGGRDQQFDLQTYLRCINTQIDDLKSETANGHLLNKKSETKITANNLKSITLSSFEEELNLLGYSAAANDYDYRIYIRVISKDSAKSTEQNIESLEKLPYQIWNVNFSKTEKAINSSCRGYAQIYLAIKTEQPKTINNYDGILPIYPKPQINEEDGTIVIIPHLLEWVVGGPIGREGYVGTGPDRGGYLVFRDFTRNILIPEFEKHRTKSQENLSRILRMAFENWSTFNTMASNVGATLITSLEREEVKLANVFLLANYINIDLPADVKEFMLTKYYKWKTITMVDDDDYKILTNILSTAFSLTTDVENDSILLFNEEDKGGLLQWGVAGVQPFIIPDIQTILKEKLEYKKDIGAIEAKLENIKNIKEFIETIDPVRDNHNNQDVFNLYIDLLKIRMGEIITTEAGLKILNDYDENQVIPITPNSMLFALAAKQAGATGDSMTRLEQPELDNYLALTFSVREVNVAILNTLKYRDGRRDRPDIDLRLTTQDLTVVKNPVSFLNLLTVALTVLKASFEQKLDVEVLKVSQTLIEIKDYMMNNVKLAPKYTFDYRKDIINFSLPGPARPDAPEETKKLINLFFKTINRAILLEEIAKSGKHTTIVRNALNFQIQRLNKKMALPLVYLYE